VNIGLYLCTCKKSSSIDCKKVKKGLDVAVARAHDHLCGGDGRDHIVEDILRFELDVVMVGCGEKLGLFEDTVSRFEGVEVFPVNLREHCGWVHGKKEATEKAARMLHAALLEFEEPPHVRTLDVDVGDRILVLGVTPALEKAASGLEGLAEVEVVRPWEVRDISGRIGDFRATILKNPIDGTRCIQCGECLEVCPGDAIDGWMIDEACDRCGKCVEVCPVGAIVFDVEEELEAGQVLVDTSFWDDGGRWGIYPVGEKDYEGAMEAVLQALASLGTVKKPKYIETHPESCAGGKSEIIGCTLCQDRCAHGAISRDGEVVVFDETSCFGCGNCASVCPLSVPGLLDFPEELVFSKMEALLGGSHKVLMFTCPCGSDVLDRLGREKTPYPPVLPLVVPCLGAVGEEHILKAFHLGAEGIILLGGHDCENGVDGPTPAYRFAESALEALGLHGRLEFIKSEEEVAGRITAFVRGLSPSPIKEVRSGEVTGADKRDLLVALMKDLSAATGKTPSMIIQHPEFPFATLAVGDDCTLCAACSNMCPTGALSREDSDLHFRYGRCIACGMCAEACPEGVLSMEKVLDFPRLVSGRSEGLFSAPMTKCSQCGRPFAAEAMVRSARERIKEAGAIPGGEFSLEDQLGLLDYCEDCRALVALEIYQGGVHGD
jgi:heterodisulfide reductase subunit A-like polyferredoxin/coenzyme F420-reducing hydrogenase delta subunit